MIIKILYENKLFIKAILNLILPIDHSKMKPYFRYDSANDFFDDKDDIRSQSSVSETKEFQRKSIPPLFSNLNTDKSKDKVEDKKENQNHACSNNDKKDESNPPKDYIFNECKEANNVEVPKSNSTDVALNNSEITVASIKTQSNNQNLNNEKVSSQSIFATNKIQENFDNSQKHGNQENNMVKPMNIFNKSQNNIKESESNLKIFDTKSNQSGGNPFLKKDGKAPMNLFSNQQKPASVPVLSSEKSNSSIQASQFGGYSFPKQNLPASLIQQQPTTVIESNFDEDVGMSDVTPASQSPIATPASKSIFTNQNSTTYSLMTQGSGESKSRFPSTENNASFYMSHIGQNNTEKSPNTGLLFSMGTSK